eukprot:g4981.t1
MADVLVLYGSMTGSAQEIARRIHEEAEDAGMSSELTPMNKWKDFDFASYQATVFIVSTTGNGDAPDHAETGCDKFWRFIKRRSQPADLFEGTQFTVLGLGDTNYDKFCQMGKLMNKRLGELGGESFYDLGCADDAVGLDTVVEPWIEGLWPALRTLLDEEDGTGAGGDAAGEAAEEADGGGAAGAAGGALSEAAAAEPEAVAAAAADGDSGEAKADSAADSASAAGAAAAATTAAGAGEEEEEEAGDVAGWRG